MQLYAKCIQLESQKEMFRLFKALGKYISGLDQALTEPEIYGPATIDQINNGKHMKKSFEANSTLKFCQLSPTHGEMIAKNFNGNGKM